MSNASVDPAQLAWSQAPRDAATEAEWLEALQSERIHVDRKDDDAPQMVVASVEPTTGDPQLVAVHLRADSGPFWVDRRTMRPQRVPERSSVREDDVMRVADLGDRVHLVLGRPVLVRIGMRGDRLVVEGVRALPLNIGFTRASYRKLSPMMADPGTLAPLAIDAIDRALRIDDDPGDEPRVRRIYGQAYRRMDDLHTPWRRDEGSAARRAVERMARLGRDVMLALDDARAFRRELNENARDDADERLRALGTDDLLSELHVRMGVVVRALSLLERARLATLSLIPAIEALVGPVPRDVLDALAAPYRTRERRAVDEKLVALGRRCMGKEGKPVRPDLADPGLRSEWARVARALQHVRILGMDVRPAAIGSDDAHMVQGMQEAWACEQAEPEERRKLAERRLIALSAKGPLGPVATPSTGAQLFLLRRLSKAKGSVAEGLSRALLRLRAAACEAGRRLAADGVLDDPLDALYMPLDEIEEALRGELGAYAARVRLRREDDRRFRHFVPPRRIAGKRVTEGE